MANEVLQFTWQDWAHLELIYRVPTYADEGICIDK
jgi:hypothetical protein